MRRTSTLRGDAGAEPHLAQAERLNPEWGPWLRLLRLTLAELTDPGWDVEVQLAPSRPNDAPLLDGAVIALSPREARAWISALRRAAVDGERTAARALGTLVEIDGDTARALALLEAAIRMDGASAEPDEPDVVGTLAQLAAMPVLFACRRRLASMMPKEWGLGYCPVCGAWPTFAELRGLERERRLRCGRCGADWRISVLRCPYCGESDHKALGALLTEGEEETRRVDTCHTCRGYVKGISTLMALPDARIAAEDVATVHLDLVALDRGFARPEHAGHRTVARVIARGRSWR